MSSSLPMYNFWLFGSTPGSAIPFLWECSRKSGPRNMSVNMGVLPMPSRTIFLWEHSHKHGIAVLGVLPKTINYYWEYSQTCHKSGRSHIRWYDGQPGAFPRKSKNSLWKWKWYLPFYNQSNQDKILAFRKYWHRHIIVLCKHCKYQSPSESYVKSHLDSV